MNKKHETHSVDVNVGACTGIGRGGVPAPDGAERDVSHSLSGNTVALNVDNEEVVDGAAVVVTGFVEAAPLFARFLYSCKETWLCSNTNEVTVYT